MPHRTIILGKLHQILADKIDYFQGLIDDLRSSNTETKSSMGDKYETSREMLQQEIRQVQSQLLYFQDQQEIIRKIKKSPSEKIAFGSIVKTSFGNFFISGSLGEFEAGGEKFIGISAQTPIAQQLLGKKAGDAFEINQITYTILETG